MAARADVGQLLRRHDQLKRKRTLLEQNWRECYDYTYPLRGAMLAIGPSSGSSAVDENAIHSYARDRQAKLMNGVGTDCTRLLSSSLVAGTTPGVLQWVGYSVPGVEDEDLPDDGALWLEDAAHVIQRNIHASNFDAVHPECEIDTCVAGWFTLFVDEDPEGGFSFEQWNIASVWAAASKPGGPLDTFHREVTMTAEQVVGTYGEEMVSSATRQKASSAPDEGVTLIQCIYPRPGPHGYLSQNLPFASVHIERDTRKVVREKGYHECPVIAPRWLLIPNSVYPVGPVFDALPDIKSLNKADEMSFGNMDLALAGMWIGEDDGVLNPRTLKVGPRKIVVANSVDSLKPLEPPGDFQLGAIEIDRLERRIRKTMMADILEPYQKPGVDGKPGQPISATQAQINVELIRQLLGPIYGRWLSEFIAPFLRRCFGVAYRAGALGRPPESLRQILGGREPSVKYLSPIARAQQLVEVQAMDRFETTLAQEVAAGVPQVADNYDWDKAARKRAKLLAVPGDLIVDEDERDARRDQRAKQAAAQQAGAAAFEMTNSAIKKGAVQ
jgi:hypothetical protein